MKLSKLSLRDLFWLVLVVTLVCGWWLTNRQAQLSRDRNAELENRLHEESFKAEQEAAVLRQESERLRSSLSRAQKEQEVRMGSESTAIERLKQQGASVILDQNGHATHVSFQDKHVEPDWLVDLLPLPFLDRVTLYRSDVPDEGLRYVGQCKTLTSLFLGLENTDDGLSHLVGLENLKVLHLGETRITDDGMTCIAHFGQLERLWLYQPTFTGTGLKELCNLTQLRDLYMGSPTLGDDALVTLPRLPNLRHLSLANSRVSDAGMRHITPLKTLEWVIVGNSQVTATGEGELKQSIPGCKVTR